MISFHGNGAYHYKTSNLDVKGRLKSYENTLLWYPEVTAIVRPYGTT